MVRSRTTTAFAGLVLGVGISVAAWIFFETVLFFLFLPFVPFLFGFGRADGTPEQTVRHCPQCSFRTSESAYEYCPRDGRRLRDGEREYASAR
ncbi:hypothetical protein [Natronorubrum sulfidifaciens]|uniref:Uncharacterized protein n=1 Tax=Natronorubrum sulfidifaciens JCM 14089 TaxID=1230460 RepID=L9W2C7_9EURY|nr:hypothetical protein [Natronorubrum sulfidifaciens]ELY42468.1 hypothetical protein C495_14162 [Natronorubrum sulfidifaciens JCM 14089]